VGTPLCPYDFAYRRKACKDPPMSLRCWLPLKGL
jgi:hypothetical protein